MFGSEILDVAIGLALVYLIVSVICSAAREGIEAWLKTRAVYLEHGIRQLLQDRDGTKLAKDVFKHPLVFGLFTARTYKPGKNSEKPALMRRGTGLPSYIPSRNFAKALLDIAVRGPLDDPAASERNAEPMSLDSLRRGAANMENAEIRRVLLTAIDGAQGDLNNVQKAVEDWYDSGMDRISGWYKRSTHKIVLALGLLIAVGMNVDSIAVIGDLYKSDATRAAAVAAAGSAQSNMTYQEATKTLDSLHLPVGWTRWSLSLRPPENWEGWSTEVFFPWIGWILTAIAASFGAPFWFDVLNKFMVIRSTVKPREKSREEGSEDRQPPAMIFTAPAPAVGGGGSAAPPPPGGSGVASVVTAP